MVPIDIVPIDIVPIDIVPIDIVPMSRWRVAVLVGLPLGMVLLAIDALG